jgi:hypothetical protein
MLLELLGAQERHSEPEKCSWGYSRTKVNMNNEPEKCSWSYPVRTAEAPWSSQKEKYRQT